MTAARGSRVALLALGTPGGGPELFAQGWPTGRTRLEVRARGVTVPPTAWRAFLPGPLDAHHGLRDHAVALTFDARAASRVVDGKTIAVRLRYHASHGPQPALEVRLNGVGAWLHPQVVRDDRREVYMPTPIAGVVDRVLVLPGALLRPTGNRLEIVSRTPDPGPRPDAVAPGTRRGWHGALFGSGLEWDHLEVALTEDAVLPTHAEIAVSPLQPRGPDGRAMTRIEVLLTGPGPLPASTRLHVAGRGEPVELPLPDGHPARGDVRWLVDLPALTGPTEVRLVTDPEDGRPPLELVRTLHPARPWVVHVIPHVHLDVGYTDAQGAVVEIHARNLDRLLGMTDGEMGYRFAIDGSLVVEQFLATRHPAGGEALLARLRDGRIDVNAYQALFLAGIVSHEELYRATTYAFELAARTGAPVEYANLTDVPAYPTSLPTALASLGIGSFLGIQNHFRASTATSDTLHLASPFRWQGPDGSEVVTFLADQYGQVRWLAGDPPGVAGLEDGLTRFIRRFDRPNHVPDDLPLIGIAADNEDIGDGDRELVGAWNARYAFPRLEWSTPRRYFAQVAAHRADLPVIAGDGGSWWEDGLGAAAAAVARYRRAQEALLAADGLAALVTPAAAQLTAPHAALRAGWDALLLGAEHTWTSAHATAHPESEQTHDQLAWKVRQIDAAAEAGQFEQGRILGQLAELIGREAPFVATVNLASWTRDIPVEVELRPDEELREAGRPLREVVLWDDGGRRRVRTAVRGVPPFGYRTIEVAVRAVSRIRRRRIARRPRCSAEVDPVTGYVHHLADGSGRELLDPARGAGLGQVLHVAGGGDRIGRGIADATMLLDRTPPRPEPRLTVTPSVVTSVEQIDDADGRTIRTLATAPAMPEIRTEVLLPARGDRVRVTVTIEKVPELAKESVYVAFPFGAGLPRIRYARQVGIVDPARDHLPGAGNDWICVGDWAALTDEIDGRTIAWASADAPLLVVGDVVRGAWAADFRPDGLLLSWMMNNHWMTNTPPSQGGRMSFTYAFEPMRAFDPVRAHRLGRELRMSPLVRTCRPIDKLGRAGGPLPSDGRLLEVTCSRNVAAYAVTGPVDAVPMLRVRQLAGRAGEVRIDGGRTLVPCHPVTGAPAGPATTRATIGRWGVASFRIEGSLRPAGR